MTTFSSRRRFLRLGAPLAWMLLGLRPLSALAAAWPKSLFDSATSKDALGQLQAQSAEPGKRILLDVPEIADRNDRIEVRVMSTLPATEQITILVDKALRPVVAQFNFTPEVEADVTTTIKLPGTSTVRAIVKAGGKIYAVSKEIKLALEPWDGPLPGQADQPQKPHKAGQHKKASKA